MNVFKVLKYGNDNESNTPLGAKFVLLNSSKQKVATIVTNKLTGWADVPNPGQDGTIDWPKNTVQTTDNNGDITIQGLDSDTYYLYETDAPRAIICWSGPSRL